MGSDPMIFNIINKKNAYKEHIQLCKIISRDIFYAKNHIRCGCGFSSYIFINYIQGAGWLFSGWLFSRSSNASNVGSGFRSPLRMCTSNNASPNSSRSC